MNGYVQFLISLLINENEALQVISAIALGEFVKTNWAKAKEEDRVLIKTQLVHLTTTSTAAYKQLINVICSVSRYDFPEEWPELISDIVDKCNSKDYRTINIAFEIAHSLFKRYRYEIASQRLWKEIQFVLNTFAATLIERLTVNTSQLKKHRNNAHMVCTLSQPILLISKIFHSLVAQDLPSFFDENSDLWLKSFYDMVLTNHVS